MYLNKTFLYLVISSCIGSNQYIYASGPMDDAEISNVSRIENLNEADKQRISTAAGLLADYEILAKKLINNLKVETSNSNEISNQAKELMLISENVITNTKFRLPQCKEYLEMTFVLKNQLEDISHDNLEKNYHHDAALPKAPVECYHTKDLFVHPATVIVLTRDDPSLNDATKQSITAEISEVLGHTELVRRLVIY
jgi:hypothetical protein